MENFVSPYVKNIQTNARIKRIRSIIYPKMFSLRLIFQSKTFQERLFYINVKLEIHKGSKNFMGEISKANRSRAISKYQHDKRISDLISRHERFVSVPRKRGIAKVIVRVAGIGWWVTIVRFTDEWKMGEKKRMISWMDLSIRRDTKGSVCAAALWKKRWFHCNTISAAPFLTQSRW